MSATVSSTVSLGPGPWPYEIEMLGHDVYKVTWGPLDTGESGDWIEMPGYPEKTVQISGRVTTTVVLQGSNELLAANPVTLKDKDGTTSIGAAGIYTLKDNPLHIRPVVTTGQAVMVTMICSGRKLPI